MVFLSHQVSANNELYELKKDIGANIFFLRHAIAPGFGDPENFKLDDCSTQRNLSNDGINQAREISNEFSKYVVKFTKVYSSYWCRCYETVKSMGLKNYQLHSGLNSFYQNHVSKKEVMKDLNNLISSQTPLSIKFCMVFVPPSTITETILSW